MERKVIRTDDAPQPVGAYSQALAKGGLIFTSGQLPLEAKTGILITGSIQAEVKQALHNVRNIIEAGGCSLTDIVKVTVFLTDMSLFKEVDSVYAEFFGQNKPARSIIGVNALPKSARVEIEAIAVE